MAISVSMAMAMHLARPPDCCGKSRRNITLGVVYRSPFAVNFDGRAVLTTASAMDGPHSADASIQFPQSVAGGLRSAQRKS